MKPNPVTRAALAAGLALSVVSGLAGCGGKDQAATSPGAAPPGGAALPAQARSAMEAQQQRESADRAAHAPRPH